MKYGANARVGNLTVFSPAGAIAAYRIFCMIFDRTPNIEASAVLSGAMDDMLALGFTPTECEAIESDAFSA